MLPRFQLGPDRVADTPLAAERHDVLNKGAESTMVLSKIVSPLLEGQMRAWLRSRRRTRVAVAGCVILGVAWYGASRMSAQSAAGTIRLQPAPDLPGVIKGGTRPQLIATGLKGADDPIWLPS